MADAFCGQVEGHPGCASYRLFVGHDYSMVTGARYGFAFSLVIYLAKGGRRSGDAPYVIPSRIITGGLAGVMTSSQHI